MVTDMTTDRRHFLTLVASAALALVARRTQAATPRTIWLSANADTARQYALGAFDENGQRLFELDLPGRGHGIAVAPDRRTCVAIARRPGTFAAVVDLKTGQALRWLESPAERHFHGHGAFSDDGRTFFTSENDFNAGRGIIGVWDVADGFRRMGELDAHGIEPHDIRLMPDGRTLAVANGGIRTHPDRGRARLNLDGMDSSLLHIDVRTGALIGQWRLAPDLQLLSIRHLSVNGQGEVAIGLQHQTEDKNVPIVGLHRPGGEIALLEMPSELSAGLRNYCGSVAMDASGSVFAASCPKGNTVTLWEASSGRFVGAVKVPDGCGVAAGSTPGSLLMTSGQGGAWLWQRRDGSTVSIGGEYLNRIRWDNHAVAVTLPMV
jgi:hypothetical protein